MVVVQLQSGMGVSLKNSGVDEHISGAQYSSFSGFLLYESYETLTAAVGKRHN